ncbi:MAG: hypothetical protein DMG06_05750 [Acidobacteria bacterium]|nr:MAG: hypothetical protein DMG06_05750 [Acidobacteriota bacterium]
MAVVVVFTTVLLVTISGAMINWQKAMQREREEELIFRGKQFIRAIELWQRKFPGTFPTTIDALLNTNNVRFLRKKWKDPITNSDEWRLIKLNPDGSISGLTIIPSGGLPEATIPGAPGQRQGRASGSATSERSGFPPSGTPIGSQSSAPSTGSPQAGQAQRSRSQAASTPVLGGIIGVASTSEKQTLKTYNGRNKYNEWEFYYVPRQQLQPTTAPGQQPAGQRPGIGSSTGIQSQPSPSPFSQQQPPAPSR